VTIPIRVINKAPPSKPVPNGWEAVPFAGDTPPTHCEDVPFYEVALEQERLAIREAREAAMPKVTVELRNRLLHDYPAPVKFVFTVVDGWLVMSDFGEFGGGIDWYAVAGGSPRRVIVGLPGEQNPPPQNVQRAQAIGGKLFVLQGLAHLGDWVGQLAAIWRERSRFSTHVVARYRSEPVDWIRESEGVWLVLTHYVIWRTYENGTNEFVALVPVWNPNSLLRLHDGVLLVGARGGVLRLTPTWDDTPRYASEFLVPKGWRERICASWLDQTDL
jgi:hypothetical protein